MKVINFSHPLTDEQRDALLEMTSTKSLEVIDVRVHVDLAQPLGPQVAALADEVGLTPEEWQMESIIVNPPGLASVAAALLAHLHGRMGYFPPVIVMRRVPDVLPPRFEVAEVLDLDGLRKSGREAR